MEIEQSEVSILWSWEPHSDLAETAGAKMGVPSEYCQILSAEANTPDSWIRYPGDHFWYVSIRMGDGPFWTKYYANEAREYLKKSNPSEEDIQEGYKRLSWSMHYMSDLANPWHTTLLYGQAYHFTYEDYVSDNWNSGHDFNKTIQDDWYYYSITDPEASAKNMAGLSNQYMEYLVTEIRSDPNWKNDKKVVKYTKTVLTHGIRYDIGLLDFATR